ncbi:MAG: hypothetical protein GX112_01030 [Clostridiaceae bacterium]|nr:hypothetical protein [Clostridiaceae bacterium]
MIVSHTALLLDIMDSRKLDRQDRASVQHFTRRCLQDLNQLFRPSLVFAVMFSAGDEMQGLFRDTGAAYLYVRLLKLLLAPLTLRCGIGVGAWDVRVPGGTSAEQDGPAYHRARLALEQTHETAGNAVLLNTGGEMDLPLNAMLLASVCLASKQSLIQADIHLLVELLLPFFDDQAMDAAAFPAVGARLADRDQIPYFHAARAGKQLLPDKLTAHLAHQEPIRVYEPAVRRNEMQYATTLLKGIAARLAEITGTSRQNSDNILRKADIQTLRQIDLAILYMLRHNL